MQNIKNSILHEDDQFLVLNKPSNLVTIGGEKEVSLYSLVVDYLKQKNKQSKISLFAVHRLDFESSGIVVFAKDHHACKFLQEAFKKRAVFKQYVVVVNGNADELFANLKGNAQEKKFLKIIENNGYALEITLPIWGPKTKSKIDFQKGQSAYTKLEIIKSQSRYSLLLVTIKSGRMHQIRCHLGHIGLPVVGDGVYGDNQTNLSRIFLHSHSLSFFWKGVNKKYSFKSPIPKDFLLLMQQHL